MTEKTTNYEDLINSVLSKQPDTFANAFNDIMSQKAVEAIDLRKQELARTMFSASSDQSQEEESLANEQETEDENVN